MDSTPLKTELIFSHGCISMVEGAVKRTRRAAAKIVFKDEVEEISDSEAIISDAENEPEVVNSSTKRSKSRKSKACGKPGALVEEEDYRKVFLADDDDNEVNPSSEFILELNTYWPSPMNATEPLNDKLLLVDIYSTCGKDGCSNCGPSKDTIIQLKLSTLLNLEDYRCGITMSISSTEDRVENDRAILSEHFRKAREAHSFYHEKFGNKPYQYKGDFDDKGNKIIREINCAKSVILVKELYVKDVTCCRSPINGYVSDNDLFKFYSFAGKLYVYLDTSIVTDFSSQLPDTFYSRMYDNFRKGYFRNGGIEPDFKETLSDTFDFPEAVIPEGFSLKLRDYQLRSLSWMKAIESNDDSDHCQINNNFNIEDGCCVKIKFGSTGFYLDPIHCIFSSSPQTLTIPPLRIKGGLLADDTGSGKTITCLALIHAAPFAREDALRRKAQMMQTCPYRIPSRATCVVCPSNLQKQWILEAKRCNPNFKVIGLACIRDYKDVSWNDIMLADLVVVSYQFLTNNNYKSACEGVKQPHFELKNNLKVKGTIKLDLIQFHRIMFDEIHEMEHKSGKCQDLAKSLKADYHWGITGTPKFSTIQDVLDIFPYLNIPDAAKRFMNNYMAREEFSRKFIKRNVPDLKLPTLTNEVVWVTATPSELALMNLLSHERDTATRIMMCSHYQISESITKVVGDNFMSIEKVKTLLTEDKLAEMNRMETSMIHADANLEKFLKRDEPSEEESGKRAAHKNALASYKRIYEEAKKKYEVSKSSYTFFINTLKEIENMENSSGRTCRICFCEIEPESLAMLPCSHYYCYECVVSALSIKRKCPFCSFDMEGDKKVIRITFEEKKAPKLEKAGIDLSKYGSKLIALYNYITDLLENDPTARIILFLQYSNLAKFISKTLDEINIEHVRVTGNVFKRQGAIDKFTNSKDVRLIMLSSEDSVSGINLTQATHVILLHPFWSGKGDAVDLAFEKQGISRAYRGGLTHPLKVVRFAVKDTIEEELTLKRQDIKL